MNLELVGEPALAVDSVGAESDAPEAGQKVSLTLDADDSLALAEASKEFDQGRIDGPLWTRSVAGAKGDKAQAKAAYLRSRAAALQAQKCDPGAASEAPQGAIRSAAGGSVASPGSRDRTGLHGELQLAGDPRPPCDLSIESGGAARAASSDGSPLIVETDNSLAEATREFDQGRIDGALWTRSVAGANGDKAQAKAAYLRARATALQAPKQKQQTASAAAPARMPSPSDGLPTRPTSHKRTVAPGPPASRQPTAAGKADQSESPEVPARRRSRVGIWAALGTLAVVGTLSFAMWPRDAQTEATVAGVSPAGARSSPGAQPTRQGQGQSTIQNLKGTGNWSEVVRLALAWTQNEPGNAAAWNELSIGYANMNKRDEAHVAARKAVELAPRNALYWRNLGDLNLDLDAPVEALLAFEEAISWNTQDAYSFVQAGILDARLDRLPEAKAAFTKALALNPNDPNARCGAALVARRLALPRESANPEPSDGICRELIERASAPVNLIGPTASSDAASGSR